MTFHTLTSLLLSAVIIASITLPAEAGQSKSEPPILAHDVYGTGPEKVLVLHSWMGDATSFDQVKPYLNTDLYTYMWMGAYSGPNWTPNPVQSGQPFRRKLDSDSGPNWTLIPV